MILLYLVGIHVLVALSIALWDTFIGFGFEFDTKDYPPLSVMMIFWELIVPIVLAIRFVEILVSAKEKRIEKQDTKRRLRIKLEKESRELLEELDRELERKSA